MTVVHLAAFAAPRLRGWPRLQAWLVDRVLHDEGKHVRLCMRTLSLSVSEAEMPHLQRLLAEARAVDRSFGVSGAVGMYLAGVWLRLRARFVE